MSALDLRLGYFQMTVNPSDIVKTAFVTKNGTYAFRRMPFGLSGAAPNFQKTIDIILKVVIGKFGCKLNRGRSGAKPRAETSSICFSYAKCCGEENYTVTERECLAVVWALNKFRTYLGSLPIKVITDHAALTHLTTDQLIEEQKTGPELGHIYRYLENPEDSSVNAAICENWSRDFRLVEGLLFYAKYATSLGEMQVYIPKSLRNEIMREFHDKPLAGHFGRFKTYHKIRDVCYFPYMRKFTDQYVSRCHMCQINNYKHALPAGRLIPIVSNYPNETVMLDLLGPYPVSRVRRNRYVLVITDHFSKWAEIIPLKKASARVIADNFFDNYISRFGAPIKVISDNGSQFISDIFENLSERLGIRHVKTVVYRPQANRTECINHDLVQMNANYANEEHGTWDQFLCEFAYAIRTAVNETTGENPWLES
ncbi:transposon Tf2-9 polyprotein [Trichonephila clavipes]|nr:transposon Tf2-9 polyprotein [Trichonephila clavipes]